MKCASCHSENREGRKFCGACGARLSTACPDCGFANEPDEKFCGGCGAKLDASSSDDAAGETRKDTPRRASPAQRLQERRQVTVLFADISGFTRLSQQLDPEETHALVQSFFNAVDKIIDDFGGTVDKHIGDAVMALFGAPVAHHDDPLRAVRAALEIHDAVNELGKKATHGFEVHIGVASGEVIAGGISEKNLTEYTVIGDSVNLAAWLQEQAQRGQTLISDAVYRAVSGRVTCEPLRLTDETGADGTIAAWRVLNLESDASQVQRMPIIGRAAELRLFSNAIAACKESGHGEAIIVRGEAGIGKTRLLEECVAIAGANGFQHHGALVFDFGVGKGQDAIRSLIRSFLGLASNDAEGARKVAVDRVLARGWLEADQQVFLHDLLDLPLSPGSRSVYDAMDNETRNAGKKQVLAALLSALSAEQPVLLTIEDLQWAQPVTLSYLAGIFEAIGEYPVMLTVTTRIEGDPLSGAWRDGLRGVSLLTIDLMPLARREAESLAAQFVDRSSHYAIECIERADGNPLFLEQLLRSAEEQRDSKLPASIQSLVLARMDRLDPVDKEALQAASVIGQRFSLDIVRDLIGNTRYDAAALIEGRLIRRDGAGFIFMHSLIREGAYSSLLRSRARELHLRAASHYRDSDTMLWAEQLDRANDDQAPRAYLKAAEHQQASYHSIQARLLIERGLEIASDEATRFDLHCFHGEILRHLGNLDASVEAFRTAVDVASDDRQRCRAWIGMVEGMRDSQHHGAALEILETAENAAKRLDLSQELAQIHAQRGNLYFPRGEVEKCLEQQSLALRFAEKAASADLRAGALSGLGDAEYARGRMVTANRYFNDCVELCREHGFSRIEIPNLALRGLTGFYSGDYKGCAQDCSQAIQAAVEAKQHRAELVARTALAPTQVEMLQFDAVREQCERASQLIEWLGASRFEPECLAFLAKALMVEGRLEEAEEHARKAVDISLESDAGSTFTGPWALGTLAVITQDEATKRQCLSEGERLLSQGCVSHNYLWFYRDAMEAALLAKEWDEADRFADALEKFIAVEPLPWSNFYIAWSRALAAAGRGDNKASAKAQVEPLWRYAEKNRLKMAARMFKAVRAAA